MDSSADDQIQETDTTDKNIRKQKSIKLSKQEVQGLKIQKIYHKNYAFWTPSDKKTVRNYLIQSSYFLRKYNQLSKYAESQNMEPPKIKVFMESLAHSLRLKTYTRGHLLFHMGDPGYYLMLVLTGSVECAIPKTAQELTTSKSKINRAFIPIIRYNFSKIDLFYKIKQDFGDAVLEQA